MFPKETPLSATANTVSDLSRETGPLSLEEAEICLVDFDDVTFFPRLETGRHNQEPGVATRRP